MKTLNRVALQGSFRRIDQIISITKLSKQIQNHITAARYPSSITMINGHTFYTKQGLPTKFLPQSFQDTARYPNSITMINKHTFYTKKDLPTKICPSLSKTLLGLVLCCFKFFVAATRYLLRNIHRNSVFHNLWGSKVKI